MKTVFARAKSLNDAAWRDHDNKNYDGVLAKAKESIELLRSSRENMYKSIYLATENHRLIASAYFHLGNYENALAASSASIDTLTTGITRFRDKAHRLYVDCCKDMASIFEKLGNDSEVHKYARLSLQKSLNIKKRTEGDIENEIEALEKIGDTYIKQGKYADALDCFDAALDKCKDETDNFLAKCQYNMAKTFALLKNADAAKFYYKKAISTMNDIFNPSSRDTDDLEKYRKEQQFFLSGLDADIKRKAERMTDCSATIFAKNKRRKLREADKLLDTSKNFLAVNGAYVESKVGGHSLRKRGK